MSTFTDDTATDLEVIGELRKNPSTVLRISVGDYRDQSYCYLQVYEKLEGEAGPGALTRKGLSFHPGTLRPLIPMLRKALEIATERRRVRSMAAVAADGAEEGQP